MAALQFPKVDVKTSLPASAWQLVPLLSRVDADALDQSGEVRFIATFGVKLSIWFQVSGGTPGSRCVPGVKRAAAVCIALLLIADTCYYVCKKLTNSAHTLRVAIMTAIDFAEARNANTLLFD